MCFIEYYKTKHDKPELKEPEYKIGGRMYNCKMRRRYLLQKDIIDKCWNIESITIDLDDIKHVIYDDTCHHLTSLYARLSKINTSNVSTITILNNSLSSRLCIYEILNCEWMINKNESGKNYDDVIIEKVKILYNLIDCYENGQNNYSKIELTNKIKLFKYYVASINSLKKDNDHLIQQKKESLGVFSKRDFDEEVEDLGSRLVLKKLD